MSEFRIHQIMPCPVPMKAIFYDLDGMEIIKQDILFLAVVKDYNEEGWDDVLPMIGEKNGDFSYPAWIGNFIGVEYDGESVCWDDEIRKYEKEMNDKKGGNGKPGAVN